MGRNYQSEAIVKKNDCVERLGGGFHEVNSKNIVKNLLE